MASRKAEPMLAPLLSDDESDTSDSSDDSSGASSRTEAAKRMPVQKLRSSVVYLGLGAGAALSGAAMVLAPLAATFVMGVVCIASAPYAALKERSIGELPALRAASEKLREDAKSLRDEVDLLSEEVEILEPKAEQLAVAEYELQVIAILQRTSVDKLIELVKENETILTKMRENVRQRIASDMIQLAVGSDRDSGGSIGTSEARALALRIQLALQEYGVEFDTFKFLRAIGPDSVIEDVIKIARKLMPVQKRDGNEKGERESRGRRAKDANDADGSDCGRSDDVPGWGDDQSSDDDDESNGYDLAADHEAGLDRDLEGDGFDMFHMTEGAGGGGRISLIDVDSQRARRSASGISRISSLSRPASREAGGRKARAAPMPPPQSLARSDGHRERRSAKKNKRRNKTTIDPSLLSNSV